MTPSRCRSIILAVFTIAVNNAGACWPAVQRLQRHQARSLRQAGVASGIAWMAGKTSRIGCAFTLARLLFNSPA